MVLTHFCWYMLSLSKLTAPYYSLLRVICYTLQATLIACPCLPLPHCYFLHIIPPSNKEHTFLAALCVQNNFFFICPPLLLLIKKRLWTSLEMSLKQQINLDVHDSEVNDIARCRSIMTHDSWVDIRWDLILSPVPNCKMCNALYPRFWSWCT